MTEDLQSKVKTTTLNELILDGDNYFYSLQTAISNAKSTISLETYIFQEDYFGITLADTLIKAAKRGVEIKILMDGAGSDTWAPSIERMEAAGIKVRIFHPLPWKPWQLERSNGTNKWLMKIWLYIATLNSRNHRKICIIDKKIVYIGSANINQKHLSTQLGGEGWCDTTVKLTPINTDTLMLAFNIAWHGFTFRERIKARFTKLDLDPIFRLNYTRYYRRKLYKSLIKKIFAAKQCIYVTSAYFNPDYFILRSLIKAAKRGVDVKLILPNKSDVPIMPLLATTFYTNLLKSNVEVYEFLPCILHAKVLIIDDWYCVGSSNLNQRSLRHDLEVDVKLQTASAQHTVESQFMHNIQASQRINLRDLKKQSLMKKFISEVLLFIKYFL